ncbi:hypothetical protein ACLOJK_017131 [Asimina triloba]
MLYVLLSNIYAAADRWDDARKVRNLMKAKGVAKLPGLSMIELKGMVHQFMSGDRSHPQSGQIYGKLSEICNRLRISAGYLPDTEQALFDIEDEEKAHALSVHSEKLAIAFGFMHTSAGTAIRIVKNLRVCSDCHSFTKLVSKVYGREVIVRDRNRFHHCMNEKQAAIIDQEAKFRAARGNEPDGWRQNYGESYKTILWFPSLKWMNQIMTRRAESGDQFIEVGVGAEVFFCAYINQELTRHTRQSFFSSTD